MLNHGDNVMKTETVLTFIEFSFKKNKLFRNRM